MDPSATVDATGAERAADKPDAAAPPFPAQPSQDAAAQTQQPAETSDDPLKQTSAPKAEEPVRATSVEPVTPSRPSRACDVGATPLPIPDVSAPDPDAEHQLCEPEPDVSSACGYEVKQSFYTTANEESQDGDRVTALEFSKCGNHIALGDHGGRVWIYSTPQGRARVQPGAYTEKRHLKHDSPQARAPSFEFYGQFQSHEPEFDYLKSLEIEEKINCLKWCNQTNNSLTLLAANDKTIKLWKIFEKRMQKPSRTLADKIAEGSGRDAIGMPPLNCYDTITAAIPRKVFANGHAYHINSIDVNCDGETFMSVDDLRINIWSMEAAKSNYTIQDIKPENMEDLSEVITSAIYHPRHCNIVAYSTSKGFIYLADLRSNAVVQSCTKTFKGPRDNAEKSFFSEIVASMADQDFSHCGNYIVARDFTTLKVWDVRKSEAPINEVQVHPEIEDKMCDLYECDCIFDKFQCSCSSQAPVAVTGTYGNSFMTWNWNTGEQERYTVRNLKGPQPLKGQPNFRTEKVLHTAWDPSNDNMAVSTFTGVHIYSKHKEPEKAAAVG